MQILKCINFLSADPNCLESLQRADAIKHLIPNLELHDCPLVSQVHNEVSLLPSDLRRSLSFLSFGVPIIFTCCDVRMDLSWMRFPVASVFINW